MEAQRTHAVASAEQQSVDLSLDRRDFFLDDLRGLGISAFLSWGNAASASLSPYTLTSVGGFRGLVRGQPSSERIVHTFLWVAGEFCFPSTTRNRSRSCQGGIRTGGMRLRP